MKNRFKACVWQLLLGVGCVMASQSQAADKFVVTSPDFKEGQTLDTRYVFNGFGCTGENMSPALSWKGAPKETQSFAVTVYDPDAPTGSGWWHWVVYNLPANTSGLPHNAGKADGSYLPEGTDQGLTDFGAAGYGGPCPPKGHGKHRYIFTVYALKTAKLELPANASAAMVGYMLNSNLLAKTKVTAVYQR